MRGGQQEKKKKKKTAPAQGEAGGGGAPNGQVRHVKALHHRLRVVVVDHRLARVQAADDPRLRGVLRGGVCSQGRGRVRGGRGGGYKNARVRSGYGAPRVAGCGRYALHCDGRAARAAPAENDRKQAAPRTMSTLFTRSERCTSCLLRARLEGMAGGAGGAGPSGQERVAGPCESARLYALEFFYLQTGAMAAY